MHTEIVAHRFYLQAAGCHVLGLVAEVAYPRRWTDMQRTAAEVERVRHEREGRRGPPPRTQVTNTCLKSVSLIQTQLFAC